MKKAFEIGIYICIQFIILCLMAGLLIAVVMYGKTGYDRAVKEYDGLPRAEFKLTDYLVNHYSDLRPDDVSITAINSKTYEKKTMMILKSTFDDYKVDKKINQAMSLRYNDRQAYFSVDDYFNYNSALWSRLMKRVSQSTIIIMISIAIMAFILLNIPSTLRVIRNE